MEKYEDVKRRKQDRQKANTDDKHIVKQRGERRESLTMFTKTIIFQY